MLRIFIHTYRLIKKKITKKYYTWRVARQSLFVGPELKVNAPSSVSSKTTLGRNVNFNGMNITGGARLLSVTISILE